MSQVTQDTTAAQTTDTTTQQVVTQPVQPPSKSQDAHNPLIYDEQGKRWVDKFWGATGRAKELQSQLEDLQQKVTEHDGVVAERDEQIVRLKDQLGDLGTQVANIPSLSAEIAKLQEENAALERYQLLVDYPDLLDVRVTTQEEVDGEVVEKKVNPLLNLIGSSMLPADALKAELDRLAPVFGKLTGEQQQDSVMSTATPSPGPQAPENGLQAAYDRARAAQEKLNSEGSTPDVLKEFSDAWAEVRKLEAEAAA